MEGSAFTDSQIPNFFTDTDKAHWEAFVRRNGSQVPLTLLSVETRNVPVSGVQVGQFVFMTYYRDMSTYIEKTDLVVRLRRILDAHPQFHVSFYHDSSWLTGAAIAVVP